MSEDIRCIKNKEEENTILLFKENRRARMPKGRKGGAPRRPIGARPFARKLAKMEKGGKEKGRKKKKQKKGRASSFRGKSDRLLVRLSTFDSPSLTFCILLLSLLYISLSQESSSLHSVVSFHPRESLHLEVLKIGQSATDPVEYR